MTAAVAGEAGVWVVVAVAALEEEEEVGERNQSRDDSPGCNVVWFFQTTGEKGSGCLIY